MAGCSLLDLVVENDAPGQPADAETLLAAEGSWRMVEEEPQVSPVSNHMKARVQVDPTDQKSVRRYASRGPAPAEDVHIRVLRLERQVSSLRRDFARLLPPLSSLIISDAQLDATIREITQAQQMNEDWEPASGQPTALNTIQKPRQKPASRTRAGKDTKSIVSNIASGIDSSDDAGTDAARTDGSAAVKNVRVGSHPGKARLVLDLSAPGQYRANIDNNENLLLVDLPNLAWTAEMQKQFGRNPLVRSYTAQPSNGGTLLAVELKKPSRILKSTALGPNPTYGHHRIVLDLAS